VTVTVMMTVVMITVQKERSSNVESRPSTYNKLLDFNLLSSLN
jgi:hypothetical protein